MYRKIFKLHVPEYIMKIREVLDKKIGEVEYKRYILILPKYIVNNSNLLGKELKAVNINKDKICLEIEKSK